jgi:hypothetical protein
MKTYVDDAMNIARKHGLNTKDESKEQLPFSHTAKETLTLSGSMSGTRRAPTGYIP